MKFNSKKVWDNVKEPVVIATLGTGANVLVDTALQSAESVIPETITGNPYYVNGGKLLLGAVVTAMSKNKWAQLAGTGLATVGASNIVSSLLETYMPNKKEEGDQSGQGGAPFIGAARRHMGQRGFRSARGTGSVAFMS